jgi:cytochrome c553
MKNPFPMLLALVALTATMTAAHAQAGNVGPKVSLCIGCHGIPGYQSSFPEVHKVPMISGQNEKYIASALAAYKKGDRKHPTMRTIAATLSDQDIAELAAYYAKHVSATPAVPDKPAVQPPTQVAELLKKGNCVSCHGENMNTPIDPSYPKLAGQHPDYLYAALKAYQTQKNPHVGRANPIMAGMVLPFTRPELKQIAQYVGTLPGQLETLPEPRLR